MLLILLILFSSFYSISIQNLPLFLALDFVYLFFFRFSLLQPFSLHRSIRVYGYADGEEAFSIDLN